MGTTNVSFDQGAQQANERLMQRQQISQQQRAEHQNTVGALLMDAINQSSNIKPTMKDENGNVVPNPAYEQAQQDRRNLLQQYVTLNSPEQHATFADRLHGLIFGHPTDQQREPALNPASSAPSAPGAQGQPAPTAPVTAAPPPHPFSTEPHPVLAKFDDAVKGLGNHLKAFAHPLPAQAQPDAALMAKYYRDPNEVAAERVQALQETKGQNALEVARERTRALTASLNARPPRMLSQTTIPNLLEQLKQDPDQIIYGPNGQELSPAQLAEMPAGTIAREFRAGPNVFYALGDQNSKTITVGNETYQIPSVGPIQPSTMVPISVKNPGTVTITTDPFGVTTTSRHIVPTPGAGVAPPVATASPTLKTRPSLADINANIAAANAASPKLNKGKPVSVAAPVVPSKLPPLDENHHIPAGVGNELVRQYANNLLDGMQVKDIPNPRARAAAEALASRYGWEQGKFTPRELNQLQQVQNVLNVWRDPNSGLLSVYDENPIKRGIISNFLDLGQGKKKQGNITAALESGMLNENDQKFITYFNQTVGRIQALAQLTRGAGRPTESAVKRMMSELPFPNRVSSQKDAREALNLIQDEINTALTKKEWGGGPVSSNAPKLGAWKAPADAPAAPAQDNQYLYDNGKPIAKSQGGKWVKP